MFRPTITTFFCCTCIFLQLLQSILHKLSLVMRKPAFCICEQRRRSASAKLISAFVFATWIVQSLFYLNWKFQASSYLRWLYSLVCVGPGRKPRRPVFSERGSTINNAGATCKQQQAAHQAEWEICTSTHHHTDQ